MNDLDIVLINIITYMGGIFTGLGLFIRYKKEILMRTNSHAQLKDLVDKLTEDINSQTSIGPPIIASAPHAQDLKEIIVRTQ